MQDCIQVRPEDNVAIAIHDIKAGTEAMQGVVAVSDIPQAHKISLKRIAKGGAIVRYGAVLGYAEEDIEAGRWINENMVRLPASPALDDLPWGTNIRTDLPEPPLTTWYGYKDPLDGYAGTRNILGIQTTVQCVEGVLNVALERIRRDIVLRYPHVDDVVAVNHAYGCGVAINAQDAEIPIRTLQNIARHPNFGGQLMVVALGCEKLTVDRLVGAENNTPENVVALQDCHGFEGCINAICGMAEKKLAILNRRRREELPLHDLLIGMQCGGSDAFSGVTANPAAGYAADMLVRGGATVLFSEVTEVRDGVHLIAERCVSEAVRDKLVREMRWYDRYLQAANVDRSANPTPGNKKGGLANIVEKAMGSIAKSGTSPIVEVLSPAERPTKRGEIFAATPASDMVCGPCQMASGIGLQVFMTGRGTPYNLAAVPVIKVSSRNELKEQWPDLIDISAGDVATGAKTLEEIGREVFDMILRCASGTYRPFAEQYRLSNYLCVFNPAPIT